MSIRRRLALSCIAVLALFALNLLAYFWSRQQGNAAVGALRRAISRQVLLASTKQNVSDLKKQVALQAMLLPEATPGNARSGIGRDEIAQINQLIDLTRKHVRQLRELADDAEALRSFSSS